jgi:hypothetical protein
MSDTIEYAPNVITKQIITKEGILSFFNKDLLLGKVMLTYYINIVNDSLIVKHDGSENPNEVMNRVQESRLATKFDDYKNPSPREYKSKLTDEQYLEIKKRVSALTQKYDWSKNWHFHGWGFVLTVNGQIYYQDNFFELKKVQPPTKNSSRHPPPHGPPTPEEIKLLIDYIVGLSPVPIDLY